MKAKGEPSRRGAMETEGRVCCQNCKRDVAAANFPLHEAHCLRFLAVCPQCDERLAAAAMQEHLAHAHQQVRCKLCHRLMQQYLLERHQAEECQERSARCPFCELDMPHRKLQAHLDACGSRTTLCWDCSKYVMYRALEEHKRTCWPRDALQGPASSTTTHVCQQCNRRFPDEQYLSHLNECNPLAQLLGALPPSSPGESSSPTSPRHPPTPVTPPPAPSKSAEKVVRPKRQDKALASVGRPLLKPPRSKKSAAGRLAFTAGPPAAPEDSVYDQLATCSQCNILLPGPTLQKHERSLSRALLEKAAGCGRKEGRKEGTRRPDPASSSSSQSSHLPPIGAPELPY